MGNWGLPQSGTLWGARLLPCIHSLEVCLDRQSWSPPDDSERLVCFPAVGLVCLPPPPPSPLFSLFPFAAPVYLCLNTSCPVSLPQRSGRRADDSRVPSSPSPARLGLLCFRGQSFPELLAWPGEVWLARLLGLCLASAVAAPAGRPPPPLFLLVTSAVASGPQTLFSPNYIAAEESHANRRRGLAELGWVAAASAWGLDHLGYRLALPRRGVPCLFVFCLFP